MARPLIEVVKVGRRGELTLPRKVRAALGIQEGDQLILTLDDKRIMLERRARGFSTYLDVMSTAPEKEETKPVNNAPRRGLARFLAK